MRNVRSWVQVVLCVLALAGGGLAVTGCQAADPGNGAPLRSLPDTNVALCPGDLVDVKFFYTPDLNEKQVVRPDGKITLQLVGDVTASGRTPPQLQDILQQKYSGLIEKPSIVVIARELAHRNVYIGGSVLRPGLVAMPGHLSVLEGIMNAGGFDMRSADTRQVFVIRVRNGKRIIHTLDFKKALDGESVAGPFYLHAQDIVYVPRTGVVKTAQWIDQYITQMIPKTGFSLFYNTGSDEATIGMDTTSKY